MEFRKKPVVIQAVRWNGHNLSEMHDHMDVGIVKWGPSANGNVLYIQTLEGEMRANEGDWIIKGVKGEFYPCKPDIFDATYEPVL